MIHSKLARDFYLSPTLDVAHDLLGMYLVKRERARTLSGRIVEVEAYLGRHDPASHTFRGMTRRNEVMYRAGGHLYVYFTYGMHFCCNVVTEDEGIGHAVLVRALEPVEGLPLMRRRRHRPRRPVEDLCNGPAKICQAFGIGRRHNGVDLCGDTIWIERRETTNEIVVGASVRVGIRQGKELPWRFFIEGSRFVSTALSRNSGSNKEYGVSSRENE